MSFPKVLLIQIGFGKWRRWMIWDREKDCYWCKGRWRQRRRDGEIWYEKADAIPEFQIVRSRN